MKEQDHGKRCNHNERLESAWQIYRLVANCSDKHEGKGLISVYRVALILLPVNL